MRNPFKRLLKRKPDTFDITDEVLEASLANLAAPEEEKGEFLPDMTDAEVLDYERKERLGWKDFKLPWN